MKHLILAATLGLSAVALAGPATQATPATPAAKAAPAAQLPPECVERMKKRAARMKENLGLTDAQADAIRAENERYRGQLMSMRDAHRAAIDKILTPEQRAKAEAKRGERKEKRMARMERRMDGCRAADDEDEDDDEDDAPKGKGKR